MAERQTTIQNGRAVRHDLLPWPELTPPRGRLVQIVPEQASLPRQGHSRELEYVALAPELERVALPEIVHRKRSLELLMFLLEPSPQAGSLLAELAQCLV